MSTHDARPDHRDELRAAAFGFHGHDWAAAARAWDAYRLHYADDPEGFVYGIVSLRDSGQVADAELLAADALGRFGDHAWLLVEQGVTCFYTRDWAEARRRFAHIRARFPDDPAGYTRGAEVALNLGDHTDALALVRAAGPRFPDQAGHLAELARQAQGMREQDFKWTARQFESLGGGCHDGHRWGFGCEFGLFQREMGIEPMGLLRWGSLGPEDLIRALDEDFAEVDRPDTLYLWGEGYWGYTQRAYTLRVDHSDLEISRVGEDEARRKLCAMLAFLRQKLLEDLEDGVKIFVYRMLDEAADMALITRMAAAVGRHGPGTLMFAQVGERDEVVRVGPNLLLATMTRFSSLGENKGFEWRYTEWLTLCHQALALAT